MIAPTLHHEAALRDKDPHGHCDSQMPASSLSVQSSLCLSLSYLGAVVPPLLCQDDTGVRLSGAPSSQLARRSSLNFFFLLFETVSCSPGWPQIFHVAEDDLELLFLLPSIPCMLGLQCVPGLLGLCGSQDVQVSCSSTPNQCIPSLINSAF